MTLPVLFLATSLGAFGAATQEMPAEDIASDVAVEEPAAELSDAPQMGSASEAIDRGLSAFNRRRYAAAEEAFRDAVAADPNSAAAAFYLGYTLYKRAEPTRRLTPGKEEAKALFAKAFELDPGFRPIWAGPREEEE
jgi:tetratricopeptide (TPR) repeat protein